MEIHIEDVSMVEELLKVIKDIEGVASYELDRYEEGIDSGNTLKAVSSLHARDVLIDVVRRLGSVVYNSNNAHKGIE